VPRVSDLRESKFLKQTDVGRGLLLTITSCQQFNVAMEGAEEHLKWCLTFAESDKPLVLNQVNAQLCEQIFKSDNTDDWVDQRIVLFADPTVVFKGKVVGGIRVRAPRTGPLPPKPAPVVVDDSDVPF
jgi:hypothetical protein